MPLKPLSVTQVNDYINRLFTFEPMLNNLVVKGDITKVTYHGTGHVYFSISDGESTIQCFLHKEYVKKLAFELVQGDSVVVMGRVSVFNARGTYSIYVKNVEKEGLGELAMNFLILKEKLQKEGLFSPAHKQDLPAFPKKIGIITSKTGAAVEDITRTVKLRNNVVDLVIFPVKVQGEGAGITIANMIDFVNDNFSEELDFIIVGRGGGSPEDLSCFNEEIVARSIYNSSIPIVSAVGHEIDVSISDLVADVRAATPTAAGQLVPDIENLKDELKSLLERNYLALYNKVEFKYMHVKSYRNAMSNSLYRRISDMENKLEKYKGIVKQADFEKVLSRGYSVVIDENDKHIKKSTDIVVEQDYKLKFSDGDVIVRCIDK